MCFAYSGRVTLRILGAQEIPRCFLALARSSIAVA
jgi:hypothetical protein